MIANLNFDSFIETETYNIPYTILAVLLCSTAEYTKVKETCVVCVVLAVTLGNTLTILCNLHCPANFAGRRSDVNTIVLY